MFFLNNLYTKSNTASGFNDVLHDKKTINTEDTSRFHNGGNVVSALNDLDKASSVKYWMQPEFRSETFKYEKNGKPNTFVKLFDKENNADSIIAYDVKGDIVGLFTISKAGKQKGAFKIVVREDSLNKGWGKKLLDEAEKQGIDIIGNIKNNSFSSSGRDLLRSWLTKKTNKTFENGGEVEKLIEEGYVKLNFYSSTPEHAKEYGISSKNPLFVQNLCVSKNHRLNGVGKKVLNYLDEYARKNNHDVIFGYVATKADFGKDHKQSFFCDADVIKKWLQTNGYEINDNNNDFYKIVEQFNMINDDTNINSSSYEEGGKVKEVELRYELLNDYYNNVDSEVDVTDILKIGDVLYGDGMPEGKALITNIHNLSNGDFYELTTQFNTKYSKLIIPTIRDLHDRYIFLDKTNVQLSDFIYDEIIVSQKKEIDRLTAIIKTYEKDRESAENIGISYYSYANAKSEIDENKKYLRKLIVDYNSKPSNKV